VRTSRQSSRLLLPSLNSTVAPVRTETASRATVPPQYSLPHLPKEFDLTSETAKLNAQGPPREERQPFMIGHVVKTYAGVIRRPGPLPMTHAASLKMVTPKVDTRWEILPRMTASPPRAKNAQETVGRGEVVDSSSNSKETIQTRVFQHTKSSIEKSIDQRRRREMIEKAHVGALPYRTCLIQEDLRNLKECSQIPLPKDTSSPP